MNNFIEWIELVKIIIIIIFQALFMSLQRCSSKKSNSVVVKIYGQWLMIRNESFNNLHR